MGAQSAFPIQNLKCLLHCLDTCLGCKLFVGLYLCARAQVRWMALVTPDRWGNCSLMRVSRGMDTVRHLSHEMWQGDPAI